MDLNGAQFSRTSTTAQQFIEIHPLNMPDYSHQDPWNVLWENSENVQTPYIII